MSLENTPKCETTPDVQLSDEHSLAAPYQVLAHTKAVLVLQTDAGEILTPNPEGVSFGNFNLGLHVQDDPRQVLHNRAQLLQYINAYLQQNSLQEDDVDKSLQAVKSIHWLNQIHSNKVCRIGDKHVDSSAASLSLVPASADALVTDLPQQALAIMTADCVPIVLHDPTTGQIAAIHAGWQGLANGVIAKTYAALSQHALQHKGEATQVSGASGRLTIQKPAIEAWIGACIGQSCYEVSSEVVEKLLLGCAERGMDAKQLEVIKAQIVAPHDDPDKAWLDLPKLAQLQLAELGIALISATNQQTNLDIKPVIEAERHMSKDEQSYTPIAYACSYANRQYYSYRRKTHLNETHTGRMALVIVRLH